MTAEQAETPVVVVRMLKNVLMPSISNLKNELLMPPLVLKPLALPHLPDARVATFDLENHRESIPVPDLNPRIPRQSVGMPDAWYQRLVSASYERALIARSDAEKLRSAILHHVRRGNIAVVEDSTGFLNIEETFDPFEEQMIEDKRAAAEATTAKRAKGSK